MKTPRLPQRILLVCAAIAAMSSFAEASPYQAEVLQDTPYAYWRLGEADGATTAHDTANGNDGTISGTVTLGQPGATCDNDTAMTFGGGSIWFPGVTGLQDDFSVEFWMKLSYYSTNTLYAGSENLWGQWLQHSSSAGAVYVGTTASGIGGGRFTITELPEGTQELNV